MVIYKRCPRCKGKVKFAALRGKYYCWECERYYDIEQVMTDHDTRDTVQIILHSIEFKCPLCTDEGFRVKNSLRQHLRERHHEAERIVYVKKLLKKKR